MGARIKCFTIENNYGAISYGDNPKRVSMEASKTYNGATGFTALDIINGRVVRRSGRRLTGSSADTAAGDTGTSDMSTDESGVTF
ncbi:hypothetical protein [Ectobacillus ponti]|uniref:Uncharacterized protein n=1 Tax=Ectobacillus ponti TaxID=2961894 RepID=A0AA41X742_9BACI|nr:hypothetical protein [Ectobacillus ponti]MCP8967508.1 hypothetical protein [Ectobacillus ponti]